jgi:ActR/RegA family two-component response regulator
MRKKTVVHVEDRESQRLALHRALDRRGFNVKSAATVAEAWKIIEELGDEIDVMVLDMRLEDPDDLDTTGADIGIRLQNEHPTWLPEFLIHSAWAPVDYYKLALRLGAAAYLPKEEDENLKVVIRHVRALALKRALRLERAPVAEKLRPISESTRNLSAAVRKFCRDILACELDACLGAPYVLLLTDENGTQNFATNTDLPTGYESLYTTLQAMAHGISNFASPYEISEETLRGLPEPINANEAQIYQRLPESAFIPLANVKNFRLSLGLLRPREGENKHPEDTGELAKVLAQYVRSTIVEHFLRILVHLDSQKRTMLKSTARLCLFLGQHQQGIIEDGLAKKELERASTAHYQLAAMADDLCQTGAILSNVDVTEPLRPYKPIEMSGLIDKARAELESRMDLRGVEFILEGECKVSAREDDLFIAVIRILQWLAQRRLETSLNVQQQIKVLCFVVKDSSLVVFEDKSNRLPEELREQLFLPFSVSGIYQNRPHLRGPGLYLPLYLAKMLVEEKYGGWLDDKSDEMESEIGHRLVMRFDCYGINNREIGTK